MSGLHWLAIAGPTASGKTALALELARHWPVEIVSVDSALVYRGMDIGTAKPTPQERAQVPHHLIDIRDPAQAYSAAEFVKDASALLPAIWSRGRLPLLVGGTMLYFKALLDGLDDMPPAQPGIRAALEAEARALGWPAMHAQLALVDPVTASRLSPNDAQRIGRALEVYRASGQAISSLQRRARQAPPAGASELDILGQPGLLLSLEPASRAWLHERIARRFEDMLAHGFLDEVRALRGRGDLSLQQPSMRCVGYRQAWEALEVAERQGLDRPDPKGLADWRDKGIFATRQLAKRQLTWLRGMPERLVLACDSPTVRTDGLALLQDRLGPPPR